MRLAKGARIGSRSPVIVLGSRAAVYWRNGVQVALTDGATRAEAHDIAVLDRVVHVVG